MIPVVAGTPLAGRRAIIVALVAVGFISFALWAHHMFTAGLGLLESALVSAASMAVAIPTAIQVFAWIATLWRGRLTWTGTALYLLGFMFIFVLGGLTGVMVAVIPFDWQVHDTYFIVAHFHYVLIGGMVFPMFAAILHWLPLINGNAMSERLARWSFGLMFVGFNVAFFPMHLTGLQGMPRRVYTYSTEMGWDGFNLISTIGAFMFAAGVLLFAADAARTLTRPKRKAGNPWNASTLEWLPTEAYGTRSIPRITSNEPLWDQPGLSEQVESGQHYLPGTATGLRETIVTSPVMAKPVYLFIIPTDSWWPLVAAAGTAGFFLLLTVKATLVAWLCGIVAVVALMAWLWQLDRPAPLAAAQVSDTLVLPVNAAGASTPAWWGTVIMLVVDATIFASFVFTFVHTAMRLDVCPPPGTALAEPAWSMLASALLLAGSALMIVARRAAGRRWLPLAVAAGLACMVAAFSSDLYGHRLAGLDPVSSAWRASIAALLAYQGLHVAGMVLAGLFLCARAWRGCVTQGSRGTLDHVSLMWHYTTVQGIVVALSVQLLPKLMG
jgi:cytochrome c oxidase subunit I+III